jgi:NADPH:quinone reductase-like Zn-dependent oxidoreductase
MRTGGDEVIVEVKAAGINPSDVKAAIGMMPYAVFPRTPGRDFAGVVVEGPTALIGREVFGSSGDLGIRRDGTHGSHLVVEASALVDKPASLSFAEAAGIGVPFVTAQEGFRRTGAPQPGETVVILGVTGKVGQAAAQIALWRGATVIGVVRAAPQEALPDGVTVVDPAHGDVTAQIAALTGGKGGEIVYNTVGEPWWEVGNAALAIGGRQVFIASFKRKVEFDIFAFYRKRATFVGLDTLSLSSTATGEVLRDLLPGFAAGALKPFPVASGCLLPLSAAREAYVAVIGATRDRLVLAPNG